MSNYEIEIFEKHSKLRIELEQKFISERIAMLNKQKKDLSDLENDQHRRRQQMISDLARAKTMQALNVVESKKKIKKEEQYIPLPPIPKHTSNHSHNQSSYLPTPRNNNQLKSIENNIKHTQQRDIFFEKKKELDKKKKDFNKNSNNTITTASTTIKTTTTNNNENNAKKKNEASKNEPNTSKHFLSDSDSDSDFEVFKKLKKEDHVPTFTILPATLDKQIETIQILADGGLASDNDIIHLEHLKSVKKEETIKELNLSDDSN